VFRITWTPFEISTELRIATLITNVLVVLDLAAVADPKGRKGEEGGGEWTWATKSPQYLYSTLAAETDGANLRVA